MARKKVVKKTEPKCSEPVKITVRKATTDESIKLLFERDYNLSKRIDRIVAAIDKSKSVKGL